MITIGQQRERFVPEDAPRTHLRATLMSLSHPLRAVRPTNHSATQAIEMLEEVHG
jgi:hypothetical protein